MLSFMKLIFIRHGESANNTISTMISKEEYPHTRLPDPELTEKGVAQVQILKGRSNC